MSNSFFNHLSRFVRFDSARAEEVNSALDNVASGFDGVEVKTNAAIKLPDGETAAALPASGARANKVLSFDATGAVVATINTADVADAQTYAAEALASKNASAASADTSAARANDAAASAAIAAGAAGALSTPKTYFMGTL